MESLILLNPGSAACNLASNIDQTLLYIKTIALYQTHWKCFLVKCLNMISCRVWETCDWTCEQWTNLAGPCTAAAWSPRGETLLFALMGEAAIYSISFQALTSGSK